MGREAEKQWGTGPGVSARRAQDLRIGDRVIRGEHPLTVTSTRLQGVRGGTVSVGFAEQGERVSFAPNELIDIQDTVGGVRLGASERSVVTAWIGRVAVVRLTEFRALMQAQFGPLRAPSVAHDHVFSALSGRTADEALAAGEDPKAVWSAVCADFDVPDDLRYGLPD